MGGECGMVCVDGATQTFPLIRLLFLCHTNILGHCGYQPHRHHNRISCTSMVWASPFLETVGNVRVFLTWFRRRRYRSISSHQRDGTGGIVATSTAGVWTVNWCCRIRGNCPETMLPVSREAPWRLSRGTQAWCWYSGKITQYRGEIGSSPKSECGSIAFSTDSERTMLNYFSITLLVCNGISSNHVSFAFLSLSYFFFIFSLFQMSLQMTVCTCAECK